MRLPFFLCPSSGVGGFLDITVTSCFCFFVFVILNFQVVVIVNPRVLFITFLYFT